MHIFFKGFFVGIALAAPIGPISILCIKRSLTDKLATGLAVGFGAATADSIYSAIAAFGLTTISHFLIAHLTLLRILATFFLTYLGFTTLWRPSYNQTAVSLPAKPLNVYTSSILLTLANPLTIGAFMGLFTLFGLLENQLTKDSAIFLILGVFLGSALWFSLLSILINYFKAKITSKTIRFFNISAGVLLLACAVYTIISIYKPGLLHNDYLPKIALFS